MSCSFQWNSRFMPESRPITALHRTQCTRGPTFDSTGLFDKVIITTQGQVVLMEQIKPGVHQLTRYTMKDGHGETVAELDYAGITRGATLSDGARESLACMRSLA